MSVQPLKRNSSSYYQGSAPSVYPLYLVIYNNQKMKIQPSLMKQIFTKELFKCTNMRLHLRKWNYRVEFYFDSKESRNEGIQALKKAKDKHDFSCYYYFQRGFNTYFLMEEWEYRNAINFSNSHPGFGENDKIPGDPKNNKPDKNEKPSKEAIEAEHRPIPINDGLSQKTDQRQNIESAREQLQAQLPAKDIEKSISGEIQREDKEKNQRIDEQKNTVQKNMVSIINRDDLKDPRKQIRQQQALKKKESQILLQVQKQKEKQKSKEKEKEKQKQKQKEKEKEKQKQKVKPKGKGKQKQAQKNQSNIQTATKALNNKQTPIIEEVSLEKEPQQTEPTIIKQITPVSDMVPEPIIEIKSKERQIQQILSNMEMVQKLLRMEFMLIDYLS